MLIVITMLNVAGMTVVLPVLPFVVLRYIDNADHLAVWVGVLETVNALCAFLVAPFLGALSDRIGRRPVIITAAFGASIGYLTFGIGGAIWVLLLGRIIQGITAGDMPALFAYVADITPADKRAKRFGLLGALTGISFMIGPAAGGLLAAIDVNLPVFVTAAIAAVVAVLSIFLLPESLPPERRTRSLHLPHLHPFKVLKDAYTRPQLRWVLLGFTLVAIPFMFFANNFAVLALDSVMWNATQIGLVVAGVGIVDIIVQGGLLGILLPRIGERGVVIAGIAAQGFGCVALAIVGSVFDSPVLVIVGALVLAAGQGGANAALQGLLSTAVGDDEQGWLAGAVSAIQSASGMIAPLLAGFLYTGIAHSAPYWLGAAMFVVAGALLMRAKLSSPSKLVAPTS
ncbi:MFS transporter [Naasia lichenicola]|uniref:TCR/Tet family MFS transporter n=1 Tax=Naasia lichenicola TaxID=2565933 RepID=A0A4S4FKT2_9MICO|nr:MFS transporter [Naasia lichenicola]THG31000.1 TCR/Tet family MFS transporter [Naasia lichenicola]